MAMTAVIEVMATVIRRDGSDGGDATARNGGGDGDVRQRAHHNGS